MSPRQLFQRLQANFSQKKSAKSPLKLDLLHTGVQNPRGREQFWFNCKEGQGGAGGMDAQQGILY